MNADYQGRTASQWLNLLQRGDVHERCAAALALMEIGLIAEPAKTALTGALIDPDVPVQMAARIALGLVPVGTENRRKMIAGLLSTDDFLQGTILGSLEGLASPDALLITAPPFEMEQSATTELASGDLPPVLPPSGQPAMEPTSCAVPVPDIAVVNVFPWWFLVGGVVVWLVLAWFFRGFWWSPWAMAITAGLTGLLLYRAWTRQRKGTVSTARFRARAWPLGAVIIACAGSFGMVLLFPSARIIVDNATGMDVRLLLDDQDWMAVSSGASRTKELTRGKYRLTVRSAQGNQVFDAHEIDVSGTGQYVLNVLGAQTYFHGTVRYGEGESPPMEMLTAKWFLLPDVDCLFSDPPDTVMVVVEGTRGPRVKTAKTFVTKGAPPRLMLPKGK